MKTGGLAVVQLPQGVPAAGSAPLGGAGSRVLGVMHQRHSDGIQDYMAASTHTLAAKMRQARHCSPLLSEYMPFLSHALLFGLREVFTRCFWVCLMNDRGIYRSLPSGKHIGFAGPPTILPEAGPPPSYRKSALPPSCRKPGCPGIMLKGGPPHHSGKNVSPCLDRRQEQSWSV